MFRYSSSHGGARRARRPGRAGGAAATPMSVPAACAAERLEGRLLLAAFTVTTPADAGPGSLRQAILDANASPGPDSIGFAIAGAAGAVHTIRPLSPLPPIADAATLDATTQPGYAGTPVIELDGSSAGIDADGVRVTARPTTVRGLAINRFGGNGIVVTAPYMYREGVFLEGNHIGTDAAGEVARPNGAAGIAIRALSVRIGGPQPMHGNIISGNRGPGVHVNASGRGGPATAFIEGNHIGTNRRGDAALGNALFGVVVETGPVYVVTNVISGNGYSGVFAHGASDAQLVGNFIGTDARAAAAVPNGANASAPYRDGVTAIQGATVAVYSQHPRPGSLRQRNVISGNRGSGVNAEGAIVSVDEAYVGTDATGSYALGNRVDGITGRGGSVTFRGSVISGNAGDGVRLQQVFADAQNTYLFGNRVGTNAAGTAAVGNGGNGISLLGCQGLNFKYAPPTMPTIFPPSNFIAGNAGHGVLVTRDATRTGPQAIVFHDTRVGVVGDRAIPNGEDGIRMEGVNGVTVADNNVIAANRGNGITLTDFAGSPSTGVVIERNTIGGPLDPASNGPRPDLGNWGHGVEIVNSHGNRIGATRTLPSQETVSVGNRIAFNGGSGVLVATRPGLPLPGFENLISRNAIHGNGGLGIDLAPVGGADGVTPNDLRDADPGPNRLQNFPVITGVVVDDDAGAVGDVTIRFTLHSEPNRQYRVELFASPAADPSGHGEGARYLTTVTVTTDANGDAAGEAVAEDVKLPAYFTATATSVASTSEFSPAVRATPARPAVVGRHVFYNDSAFDGGDAAANAADDNAIAWTVAPLLPGHSTTFLTPNFTTYSRGINGVMVDVFGAFTGTVPRVEDFEFHVGNSPDPATWALAPSPAAITVRRGAGVGGSDRVTITWADGAITNAWLKVTVKANERTGLAAPDVFYFGNLIGDTSANRAVSPTDVAHVRSMIGRTNVPITERADVNRDGAVTPRDYALVRANVGRRLEDLRPPAVSPADAPGALEVRRVWDEEAPGLLT